MSEKLQFIRDSILDIQSTIRVTDTKIAVLIIILLAPLSNSGRVSAHLDNFVIQFQSSWAWLIIVLFIIMLFAGTVTTMLIVLIDINSIIYQKHSIL